MILERKMAPGPARYIDSLRSLVMLYITVLGVSRKARQSLANWCTYTLPMFLLLFTLRTSRFCFVTVAKA